MPPMPKPTIEPTAMIGAAGVGGSLSRRVRCGPSDGALWAMLPLLRDAARGSWAHGFGIELGCCLQARRFHVEGVAVCVLVGACVRGVRGL